MPCSRRQLLRHALVVGVGVMAMSRAGRGRTGARPITVFESAGQRIRVVELVRGLEHPWGLAFLPDGRMLVTERPGRLRLVDPGDTTPPPPLAGVPEVWARGQGGLLDVALDPAFADNRLVYLSYAAEAAAGLAGTRVGRGRLGPRGLEDFTEIFVSNALTRTGRHFGSRLTFDARGDLFVTLGDRAHRALAQDLRSHAGKVVRIRPDGSVPADNPFVGRSEALPEIYTYGHRNPQGMDLEPATGEVWIHEHGPQGGDEVNVLMAGANYGWPVITWGREYGTGAPIGEGTSRPDVVDPLRVWIPSIAPSGMAFYDAALLPAWRGDLLIGALRARCLVRLRRAGRRILAEERLLQGVLGRIRDVRIGPEGAVYLLTDHADGGLYRLEPA